MKFLTIVYDGKEWSIFADPSKPHAEQLQEAITLSLSQGETEGVWVGDLSLFQKINGPVLKKQSEWFAAKAKEEAKEGERNQLTADEAAKEKAAIAAADAKKLARLEAEQKEQNESSKESFAKAAKEKWPDEVAKKTKTK
jgi:hypothetical protein